MKDLSFLTVATQSFKVVISFRSCCDTVMSEYEPPPDLTTINVGGDKWLLSGSKRCE